MHQGNARMSQQRELHGEADPIGIPTSCRDQFLIRT